MKIDMKRLVLWLVAIMIGSFIISGMLFVTTGGLHGYAEPNYERGEKFDIDEIKNFEAANINTITVRTVNTYVNIIPENREDIKAHFYGDGQGKYPSFITNVKGTALNIEIEHPKIAVKLFDSGWSKTTLDIYIPETYSQEIKVKNVSGEIAMGNLNLNYLSVETVSGNIKLSGCQIGNFHSKTVSGNIDAKESVIKKSDFKTTSGKILIEDTLGNVRAETVSGKVFLGVQDLTDDIYVKTISGAVQAMLPKESGFNIDYSTVSGDANSQFPVSVQRSLKKGLNGTVNDGEFDVIVNTVSGDLDLWTKTK